MTMRVVVMGGTSGIGLATAERLTAAGAEVTVTGRDAGRLAAVEGRVKQAEQFDGTDYEQVLAFFGAFGEFDHLVVAFSQGASGFGPVRDISTDAIRAAFEGKLFGYLYAIQHAQVTGSITLISAASARGAAPGTAVLAAANGAIERMVPPLAAELAPVRVNAVSPGVIDTAWWSFLDEDARRAQFESFAADLPAGRVGTAADVADAVAYLIGATYVTGAILPVDGGFSGG
jgi:NAD(P)-dependent dehydrogenase (short-subunit alcohol dehydrogenase family)